MSNAAEVAARTYIQASHGSLVTLRESTVALEALLAPDVLFSNELQQLDLAGLLGVFRGWAAIVAPTNNAVRIHHVFHGGANVALAHWETDYDAADGARWYGCFSAR